MEILDYFGRVLVINLERDSYKYDKFINSFSKSTLIQKLDRFKAVDGKVLDLRIIGKDLITDSARSSILTDKQKTFGISLTYGALGCALSHYLIMQDCVNQKLPYLIFEDDCRIIDTFDEDMNKLVNHIKDLEYDLLYLGLHNIPSLNKQNSYNDILYLPMGLTCGTWAMIITPSGANKILNMIFPLSVQIDSEISKIKPKLKVYATKKELAKHSWEFRSTTQQKLGCETLVGR